MHILSYPLSSMIIISQRVNSSSPSAAYMRQWTGSSLVQVMACRLFGVKQLPEPMRPNRQLDSWEQISVKFEPELCRSHSWKCIWKCRLPKWRPYCPGGDELSGDIHERIYVCEDATSLRSWVFIDSSCTPHHISMVTALRCPSYCTILGSNWFEPINARRRLGKPASLASVNRIGWPDNRLKL